MVLAEDPSFDLGTSGTADVEEEAREVGLGRHLGIDPQALSDPHRDQRAVQPVLERRTDTEVGGQ
jgi:hypothetical protein